MVKSAGNMVVSGRMASTERWKERAYIARKELPVRYDYADRDSYFFMKRLDRKTRKPWKSPPDQFP